MKNSQSQSPNMLNQALTLQKMGFHVFPLGSPFEDPPTYFNVRFDSAEKARKAWPKTPRMNWSEFQTTQPGEEQVRAWWTKWPSANIAIVTGIQIVVVDADSQEAMNWCESGAISQTPCKVTTGRGCQYYYRAGDQEFRNMASAAKLDIRGVGGYVVGPGSTHSNGKQYCWLGYEKQESNLISALPSLSENDLEAIYAFASTPDGSGDGENAQLADKISSRKQKQVKRGERNNSIASLAGQLLTQRLSIRECREILTSKNKEFLPPLEQEEIDGTLLSIVKSEFRNHPPILSRVDRMADGKVLFSRQDVSVVDMLENPAPLIDWVIPGFLPCHKVGLVVAPGGTGKGFFTLQMAVAIASGTPFLGMEERPNAAPCLVVAAEDDRNDLHRRLKAVLAKLDLDSTQQELVKENLLLHGLSGSCALTNSQLGEVHQTTFLEELVATIQQFDGIRCIVLDPASRFRGGEENSAEDNTRFIEAIEKIVDRTGATVIATHHANKSSMREGGADEAFAARGSSALTDGARIQINLSQPNSKDLKNFGLKEEEKRSLIRVSVPKSNYTKPFRDVFLKREEGSGVLLVANLLNIKDREFQELTKECRPKIELLLKEQPNRHSASGFAKAFGGKTKAVGVNEKVLHRIVKYLVKCNFIHEIDGTGKNGRPIKRLSLREFCSDDPIV